MGNEHEIDGSAKGFKIKQRVCFQTEINLLLFVNEFAILKFPYESYSKLCDNFYLESISFQADIILRGYLSWNSRRAVQVLDQIFPKVLQ